MIELGGCDAFLSLTGAASDAFDALTGMVYVELDPGQGFAEGTVLEVEISSETRIYQATGDAIDPTEIFAGARIEVDGVLVLSSESSDRIRAAVVFVRDEVAGS